MLAVVALIMPEEFEIHPSPKMEKHIYWYDNCQEQTIKAKDGCATEAL